MTNKYTITKTYEPKSFQGKNGEFKVFSIKTKETGDDYINGYYNKTTSQWKIGDIVEFELIEKQKDGKTYKNFQLPNKDTAINDRLNSLEKRISDIEKRFEAKWAELQVNLTFEKTGKFQTDEEFNKNKEYYKNIPAKDSDIPPIDVPF